MKIARIIAALLLLAGMAVAVPAQAHHFRSHVGIFIGGPVWGWYPPPYYYPPAYYYPPVVEVPVAPPVYIERESAPATGGYWYYCERPQGYYPYVKSCPGGWQRVRPQPSD